ncbi:MAG: ribonuclease P protein component [Candidatus Levybacteria bacterium RBG_16_35_6]|nr:MAG: ribonuclease P protein component [Candidatus Levybacteria bacterium RBG_16_35_6]
MLAKKNRLPAKASVKHFLLNINADFFILKVGENRTEESRFNFVVSKRLDKGATVRNRLKRQFRRFIEENCSRIRPGFDFLFKIKNQAKGKKTQEIHRQLKEVLKKEGLISEENSS